jgi:hypothetical protein
VTFVENALSDWATRLQTFTQFANILVPENVLLLPNAWYTSVTLYLLLVFQVQFTSFSLSREQLIKQKFPISARASTVHVIQKLWDDRFIFQYHETADEAMREDSYKSELKLEKFYLEINSTVWQLRIQTFENAVFLKHFLM